MPAQQIWLAINLPLQTAFVLNKLVLPPEIQRVKIIMPITSVVDKTRGEIRTTVMQPVTVKEILGHLETAQREELLPFAELIDARQAGPPYLSTDDIWSAATAVRNVKLPANIGPRAVIVDNPTMFGSVRIFSTIVSGHFPISVFRTEEAAMEWLSSQRLIRPRKKGTD